MNLNSRKVLKQSFHSLFLLVLMGVWFFLSWFQSELHFSFLPKINFAYANTTTLGPVGCQRYGTPHAECLAAVSADGGTTYETTKGDVTDVSLDTLSNVASVNSATFYYDHGPSILSGNWMIQVTDTLGGSVICSISNAAESASEITSSFNCNSITPTQLANGVWVTITNNDDKSPETLSMDYFRLEVDYEVPSNTLPVASGVSINSGALAVTLTEGATTNVECIGTVTDSDGYSNISSVTADLYRTSMGTSTQDANYAYQVSGDASCVPSNGSGTTEDYSCTFAVEYYADPTDAGSPYEGDDWTCTMTPSDSVGQGTPASDTIEMASLVALGVTSAINYGTLPADSDTGSSNETITVTNTGNREIDPQLSGTDMTDGGASIPVEQQEYSATAFTYGAGLSLTTNAVTLNLTLPQRTDGVVSDSIYWGIGIPGGTVAGTYTGINSVDAAGI